MHTHPRQTPSSPTNTRSARKRFWRRTPAHLLGLGLLCATLTPPVAASRLETDPCIPTIKHVCQEMTRDLDARKERLEAQLEAKLELRRVKEREPSKIEPAILCPERSRLHEELRVERYMSSVSRKLSHTCKLPDGTYHGRYRLYDFATGRIITEGFVWEGMHQWAMGWSWTSGTEANLYSVSFYEQGKKEGIQWGFSGIDITRIQHFREGDLYWDELLDPEGPL